MPSKGGKEMTSLKSKTGETNLMVVWQSSQPKRCFEEVVPPRLAPSASLVCLLTLNKQRHLKPSEQLLVSLSFSCWKPETGAMRECQTFQEKTCVRILPPVSRQLLAIKVNDAALL
ncbi:unnamed protein product [Leuciscus chuanchicus]